MHFRLILPHFGVEMPVQPPLTLLSVTVYIIFFLACLLAYPVPTSMTQAGKRVAMVGCVALCDSTTSQTA